MNRLERLHGMLEEDPKDSFLLFALAKEYEKMNDVDLAISYYEDLVKNDSNYTGVYYHLGAAYQSKGNKAKAVEIYKTGIEICKQVKDQHALSELKTVLMNLEIE